MEGDQIMQNGLNKAAVKLLRAFYKKSPLSKAQIEKVTGIVKDDVINNLLFRKLKKIGAIEEVLEYGEAQPGLSGMVGTGKYEITLFGCSIYEEQLEDKTRFNKTFVVSVIAVIISGAALFVSVLSWIDSQKALSSVDIHEKLYHSTESTSN